MVAESICNKCVRGGSCPTRSPLEAPVESCPSFLACPADATEMLKIWPTLATIDRSRLLELWYEENKSRPSGGGGFGGRALYKGVGLD